MQCGVCRVETTAHGEIITDTNGLTIAFEENASKLLPLTHVWSRNNCVGEYEPATYDEREQTRSILIHISCRINRAILVPVNALGIIAIVFLDTISLCERHPIGNQVIQANTLHD